MCVLVLHLHKHTHTLIVNVRENKGENDAKNKIYILFDSTLKESVQPPISVHCISNTLQLNAVKA